MDCSWLWTRGVEVTRGGCKTAAIIALLPKVSHYWNYYTLSECYKYLKYSKIHTIWENCVWKRIWVITLSGVTIKRCSSKQDQRYGHWCERSKLQEIVSAAFGIFSIQLDESIDVTSCPHLMGSLFLILLIKQTRWLAPISYCEQECNSWQFSTDLTILATTITRRITMSSRFTSP